MITSYNLEFCDIEVYKDYAIVSILDGVIMTSEKLKVLIKLMDIHYKNKPFVYISHRIHSFSIIPSIHLESSKIPNLVGFAVVSDNPLQKMQFKIETSFFKKAFKHFETMKEALQWKDEILKNW